jgi:hypothetical protein
MDRTINPTTLKSALTGKLLLDVRRPADLDASTEKLAGAQWNDPGKVSEWADTLPKDRDIVLYQTPGSRPAQPCLSRFRAARQDSSKHPARHKFSVDA